MEANCLFCKIFNGDIPAQKIFESKNVIGFVDIYPQAKNHLIFIHKKHTLNISEMSLDPQTISEVYAAIADYVKDSELSKNGYRVVTNQGKDAGQSVFHTHFHVLGGESLGHFGH